MFHNFGIKPTKLKPVMDVYVQPVSEKSYSCIFLLLEKRKKILYINHKSWLERRICFSIWFSHVNDGNDGNGTTNFALKYLWIQSMARQWILFWIKFNNICFLAIWFLGSFFFRITFNGVFLPGYWQIDKCFVVPSEDTRCVRIGSLMLLSSFDEENNSRVVYPPIQTEHTDEIVERKDTWTPRTALDSEQYVANQSLVEQWKRFNVWLIPARINKSPIEYHNLEFIKSIPNDNFYFIRISCIEYSAPHLPASFMFWLPGFPFIVSNPNTCRLYGEAEDDIYNWCRYYLPALDYPAHLRSEQCRPSEMPEF